MVTRNIFWPYFNIISLGCSVFSNLHFLGLVLFYNQAVFLEGIAFATKKCFLAAGY